MPERRRDRLADRLRMAFRRSSAALQGQYGRYRQLPAAMRVLAYDEHEIERLQLELLRTTLVRAGKNVPYWRDLFAELGFDPRAVSSLSDIEALPLTDKAVIREQGTRMVSEAFDEGSLLARSTGGSTGEPLRFHVDRAGMEAQMAINLRSFLQAGIGEGARVFKVWGYGIPLAERNRASFLTGRAYVDAFDTSEPALAAWREQLVRFEPRAIYGYAGAIGHFARYLCDLGANDLRVPVVMTTAEQLLPDVRADIEAAFGGRVVDTYGCHEAVRLATECPRGKLHLHPDAALLEFVDDDGDDRQARKILLTSFHSDGMPFIRYELGDHGCAVAERCDCGLAFPLMAVTAGKIHRLFVLPDRTVHSTSLHKRFFDVQGLSQFQIRHRETGVIEVSVVLASGAGSEVRRRLDAVTDEIRAELGPATTVSLIHVDSIPKTRRGKHQPILSDLPEDG